MGNCLVTKLKGSVQNNTLLKMGEILLKKDPNYTGTDRNYQQPAGPTYHFRVLNGSPKTNEGADMQEEGDMSQYYQIYLKNNEDAVAISVPYDVTSYSERFVAGSPSDLIWLKDLTYLGLGRGGSFLPLQNLHLTSIDVFAMGVTNLLEGLLVGSVNSLTSIWISSTALNIDGLTLANFGKFPNLTNLDSRFYAGNIEDFVNSRRNLPTPQPTGSMTMSVIADLGGERLPTSNNIKVEWTATHITVKDSGGNIIGEVDA